MMMAFARLGPRLARKKRKERKVGKMETEGVDRGGGGLLHYMCYIGMCGQKGMVFQTFLS